MRMRKPIVALAVGSVALSLALAGCSGESAASDGSVTITFWDHSGNPTRAETYRELAAQYEEENPGVTVDFLTLPSDSAFDKIQTSLASGDGPDIASMSGTFVAPLSAQGALVPLDEWFADSPLADELDPALVEVSRADARDGNLYALPYTMTNGILWYQTEKWAEAGYPEGPQSWDDFYEGAEKLTDPGAGQYGFAMRGGAGGVFQFMQAMYAESGVDRLFDDEGVSTIDDPANLEAFERYVSLYKTATSEADLGYGYPDMIAAFGSGAAASVQHNLGSYPEHEAALPGQFAATSLFESADGDRVVIADPVPSFGIFERSEHPEETWDFLEFMLSAEANGALNETIGQIPANVEARDAEWISERQSVSTASAWISDEKAVILSPPTYLPDYGTILRNEMEPQLQKVLLGELDPADFLTQWADRMTEEQQEYMEQQ
ncbi:sugar ABC transporter substrate-binding protein [Microbacterium sp. Marseille-Q6965]|uniref:ABC transporter substrate-binding protein n=1 Tax=Microbacterium sp. Marseille-Q6965 TaxID=2965072 RepID=UPI0021B79A23|nr:sugar ABC transporter substrate-binding protein [Microbacterium sp. Marseille-Q6965]